MAPSCQTRTELIDSMIDLIPGSRNWGLTGVVLQRNPSVTLTRPVTRFRLILLERIPRSRLLFRPPDFPIKNRVTSGAMSSITVGLILMRPVTVTIRLEVKSRLIVFAVVIARKTFTSDLVPAVRFRVSVRKTLRKLSVTLLTPPPLIGVPPSVFSRDFIRFLSVLTLAVVTVRPITFTKLTTLLPTGPFDQVMFPTLGG